MLQPPTIPATHEDQKIGDCRLGELISRNFSHCVISFSTCRSTALIHGQLGGCAHSHLAVANDFRFDDFLTLGIADSNNIAVTAILQGLSLRCQDHLWRCRNMVTRLPLATMIGRWIDESRTGYPGRKPRRGVMPTMSASLSRYSVACAEPDLDPFQITGLDGIACQDAPD